MGTFDWLQFSERRNVDPVDDLDRQMRRDSFFTQATLEEHGRERRKIEAYVAALLDLLFERGVIAPEELGAQVRAKQAQQVEEAAAERAQSPGMTQWPAVVIREDNDGAPDTPDAPVDCAARLPICGAVCCQLRFPLSSDEIELGRVKWDLGHPYVIRHTDEGFCSHNDRSNGHCGVYDDRPRVCKRYSCADDARIWSDFDNMVLNEEFLRERLAGDDFVFQPGGAEMAATPVALIEKPGSSAR